MRQILVSKMTPTMSKFPVLLTQSINLNELTPMIRVRVIFIISVYSSHKPIKFVS